MTAETVCYLIGLLVGLAVGVPVGSLLHSRLHRRKHVACILHPPDPASSRPRSMARPLPRHRLFPSVLYPRSKDKR